MRDKIRQYIKDSELAEKIFRRMYTLMYMTCPNSVKDVYRFALAAFSDAVAWIRQQPGLATTVAAYFETNWGCLCLRALRLLLLLDCGIHVILQVLLVRSSQQSLTFRSMDDVLPAVASQSRCQHHRAC
jgi:hypothetical protein